MVRAKRCEELATLANLKVAQAFVCDECVKTGDSWVHLRTCQTCGGTHCCDSSPNQHATRHFLATQHSVVSSAEPGEQWVWCFIHKQIANY